MSVFLTMKRICKQYPGTLALDNVDFVVYQGEVLGVIGENGAGKSTLMNIISGSIDDYTGSVSINGEAVDIRSPMDAKKHGIVTIHQELSLFPNLDIAHNIFMTNERRKAGIFLNKELMYREAQSILDRLGLEIDVRCIVSELTVSQQQMVEIARALSCDARLIIMDEPTSSLSVEEINVVEDVVAKLKNDGVSVIFITHKLNEITRFTDRLYILRDGRNVETLSRDEFSYSRFINGMIGRTIGDFYQRSKSPPGEIVLEAKGISTQFLRNVSFHLRQGEVLGIAGPVGSGRTELMQAIVGIDRIESGQLLVDGTTRTIRGPSDAAQWGIALVPEDRKLEGLVLGLPVWQNLILSVLNRISVVGFIQNRRRDNVVSRAQKSLEIKIHSLNSPVSSLSGGNQQKVVLSKWLAAKPRILLLDEPTRGIDVGAKQEIYNIINELAQQGIAIILASSELEEIIKMSDRILVLYDGKVRRELAAESATQELILSAAHT